MGKHEATPPVDSGAKLKEAREAKKAAHTAWKAADTDCRAKRADFRAKNAAYKAMREASITPEEKAEAIKKLEERLAAMKKG